MRLGTFTKTSVDNIRFQIDYTEWLETSEGLSTYEFGSDPDGITVSGAATAAGVLTFFMAGGDDGEVYNLIVTVFTNQGQVRQDYIIVTVSDPA